LITLTIGALIISLATGLIAALLPSLAVLTAEPYDAIRSAE
jgi:ABC-type antimicrobial peptide transport system permease subunit